MCVGERFVLILTLILFTSLTNKIPTETKVKTATSYPCRPCVSYICSVLDGGSVQRLVLIFLCILAFLDIFESSKSEHI